MAAGWHRLNSNGTLVKLKGLYRLNSNGTLVKLKSAYRLNSNGTLVKVFAGLETPSVKVANPPLLYLVDPSNFADPNIDAYTSYKMYLTRGRWNEDPLEFVMRIQRSTSSTFTSPTTIINETKTYATYSDSDFEDQVPLNAANRPAITNALIRAGNYYRGLVKATNSDNLFDEYSTPVVKPRIDAQLSITLNLDGTIGYNPTANGGTFSWTYAGYESIVAADVYSQTISFYPEGNTAVAPIYSESVSPGTSTTAAPTSTVVISNAALQANTTYTVVVSAVMNDLWKTESSLLQTTASDSGDFTTAAAKPATPVITSATDVGTNRPYNNGAVSLVWNQPTSSVTITGYKIEYSIGPDHIAYVNFINNTGSTSTSGTFTGLDANKNYKFYVTALSAVQNSDRSDASSSVLITTVPNAPSGTSAVAGNAEATVSFSATQNGGKSIVEYRATSSPGAITATDTVTSILVTGLTNYTNYTFTAAARNANGWSAESAASNTVMPVLPLPVGSGTVTITYDSESSYVYKITSYGTWSNSASTYDYEWQTSTDNSTWTTRFSGTNAATIPNYNAATYKGHFIRLRVYGRNQTGPAVTPLVSATTTIFYTTPIINSFSVTGGELVASYSYSYSADDPSASVELQYKLSSSSTWITVTFPPSSGTINLSSGTYDFRLFVTNSSSGAFRAALETVNSVVISNLYSFSFGNLLYPSNNGHIGLTEGSGTTIPSTGKYLSIFPGDYVGNTSASTGYMLVWSDSSKYVIRFDGYVFGQFGVASYRIQWMATFYTANNYVDIKIIEKGSSIPGTGTVGLYKNGVLVAGVAGPYAIATGSTFRVNYDGSTGSTGISYDEISITPPNDIMTTAGTKVGSGDDDVYYSITTAANVYKSPVATIGTLSGGSSTLSIPFTESNGCDYVTYTIRTGSYSGTIIQSSSSLTSPINISSLSSNTTYYITLTPYNYKNQSGSAVQTSATTAPPQPTVTFSSVTSSSFTVSWSATGATHYYVDIFNSISGNPLPGYPVSSTTNTSASPFGLTQNTSYSVTVYARNSLNGFLSTPRTVSQTTLFSGLTPTFGSNTPGNNQFAGSVTNYNVSYTWSPSVSAGTFTWGTQSGSTRPFTVSSLSDGASSTVTMVTSRSGYDNGSAQTTGTALFAALTPTFGTNTSISGGFTGSVTNYDANYTWSPSVSSGTFTWGTQSGSTRPFTVSGLSAGASSTVTMGTSRSGYKSGSAQTTGTALALTKLSTPTGVNASDNRTDGVLITWNAVSEAAYYGVWYGPTPSYDSTPDFGGPSNPSLITGTSYLDTSIGSGVTRDYYVQAFRSGNPTNTKSDWGGPNSGTRLASVSPPVNTVAPSVTPSSGTAGSTTFSSTTGSWTNSPTSYSYQWRFLDGTSWLAISGATSSTYLPPSNYVSLYGSSLRCYVTATNSGGSTTANSNTVTVSSGGGSVPATPTGVGLTGSGVVSWTASSGATSYEIEFYTAQSGTGLNAAGPYSVTGITSSPYQLVSPYASPNNWARVRVRARNSSGASAYSAWVPSETTYT
jgi:hypothetical protein